MHDSATSMPAVRLLAIVFFVGALGFAAVALLLGDVFFLRLATEALIFGGLALSVDLLLGGVGLLIVDILIAPRSVRSELLASQLEQSATGEQVHQFVQTRGVLVCGQTRLNVREIYERAGYERTQTEQHNDSQRERKLASQVGCAEDPSNGAKHDMSPFSSEKVVGST